MVTLAASAALLGLVGCAGSGTGSDPAAETAGSVTAESVPAAEQTQAPETPATSDDDNTNSNSATDGTAQQGSVDTSEYAAAIAAAEALIGDGAFAFDLEREDDDDDDDEIFNIDVAEGTTVHEIDILADGTARIDETETHEIDSEDQREIDTAELTMIEAIEAALAHHNGTIEEVELETENGQVVWTVDFEDDSFDDLHVNAVTGEVSIDD